MNYSVLARKWRPRSLQEMVGQEHILTIIANSILQNRLHHAYLFCGTRGVGKTTLARIFTKCLNCELGPTATPCNQCNTCLQIDKGNYPDLIEIDAASRTKVEDTRELLDNIQYAPTSGKYKVYLIDEVHMLSGHSFNALLKTLEEPPEHVKFLLATTDPQKLPVTVLSRCLKLSLKMLTISQITSHLGTVLIQEKINFEPTALLEIAQAAQGSMRDALSLLDQAIVFCDDHISLEKVSSLLGTETKYLNIALLEALINKEDHAVFDLIQIMEEKNADFLRACDDILDLLHHVALYQKNPKLISADDPRLFELIPILSKKISSEDVQLLYQIGLTGKRDMPFAPTLKIGFEMLMSRMMDFYPLENTGILRCAQNDRPEHNTKQQTVNANDQISNTDNLKRVINSNDQISNADSLKRVINANARTVNSDELKRNIDTQKTMTANDCHPEHPSEGSLKKDPRSIGKKTESSLNLTQPVKHEASQDANLEQLLKMFDADIQKS